jgi:hypothetical protein
VEEDCPEPKAGEVRVRVLAAGVALPDVMMREGIHPETPRVPFTPGWDLVGVVDRVGGGVSGIEPGQLVAALPIFGAYAEYVCLPQSEFVSVPPGLDPAEAVSLVLNYVTAYQMLRRSARVKAGQRALILRIENGLGDVPIVRPNKNDAAVDITIVGQPRGKFEKTAFVIMPFGEKGNPPRPKGFFDEVLKNLITPAGNAAGFAVETARREGSDLIHHTIINQLIEAELVIADLTDHNPSVLFELGIRIALKRPICLIKAEGTGPVFDVDNLMRVLSYNPNLWRSTVETDVLRVTDHINGAWETKESGHSYMSILTSPDQAARSLGS